MKIEIIIDGVDVAGCEFAKLPIMKRPKNLVEKLFGKNEVIKNVSVSCGIKDLEGDFLNYCGRNKNCYYKQLKRLEQENKELKKKIEDKPLQCIFYNNKQNKCAIFTKTVAYRIALEETKEVLKFYADTWVDEKIYPNLHYDNTKAKEGLLKINEVLK